MAFKADFRKGFLILIKALLIFLFLFYKELNREWYTSIWFNIFFRKIVMNVHNRVSKNNYAGFLMMLIGSGLSEDIKLRI